jgi:hypothetical protein
MIRRLLMTSIVAVFLKCLASQIVINEVKDLKNKKKEEAEEVLDTKRM